jgi:hypothetical protein
LGLHASDRVVNSGFPLTAELNMIADCSILGLLRTPPMCTTSPALVRLPLERRQGAWSIHHTWRQVLMMHCIRAYTQMPRTETVTCDWWAHLSLISIVVHLPDHRSTSLGLDRGHSG